MQNPSTKFLSRASFRVTLFCAGLAALFAPHRAGGDERPSDKAPAAAANQQREPEATTSGPQPFGANLFMGNFLKAREDGVNPEYVVMPGDRVAVFTWGSVDINDVFVVDGQGNIFLPQIGPVPLAGVQNAALTDVVKAAIKRVYPRYVDVYTNLLNAAPVAVFVTGGVIHPGRYAGIPSDSVLFFLDQAGGVDPRLGTYRDISIIRGDDTIARMDLYDFILEGRLPSVQFKDGDTILVARRGPVVMLSGNVAAPAFIELERSPSTGADALAVIPNSAEATEVTVTGLRRGVPFNATYTIAGFGQVPVYDGDVITLRDDGHPETILIQLEGEYQGPSVLSVKRGARLVDVLHHVPVDPELSNPSDVFLKRTSVARAQRDAIKDAVFRLERSALLALSNSKGESEIRVREAELVTQFAERARAIDPLGRVVVAAQNGGQLNVLLEDGDTLVIPRHTNVIRIGGEVLVQQAVIFRPGLTAQDYIDRAGGYSDRADDDKVILMHADASVEVTDPDTKVRPGDEILVPPEVDFKELQIAMDIMQVIYQVAMSAAVILAL